MLTTNTNNTVAFLKKYSLVDSTFIDKFYKFYDKNTTSSSFTIKLSDLASWLDVTENSLKHLLKLNFIKSIDFIEESDIKNNNHKPKIIELLTYNCSKQLCFLSISKTATAIREYYIELEKLLLNYKEEIIDDLNIQLGIKNENLNKENSNQGLIYVSKTDNGLYKIGKISTANHKKSYKKSTRNKSSRKKSTKKKHTRKHK